MRRIIAFVIALIIVSGIANPAFAVEANSSFELPIEGATGYALVDTSVYDDFNTQTASGVMTAGTAFCVLAETGSRWQVVTENDHVVWVNHAYCMINLPDVLPSIVYKATNSYAAMYKSSDVELPGVTGNGFYAGQVWNARLGTNEFMVPVLYAAAKKIAVAQASALADGNTLVIYEAYRPMDVQAAVRDALSDLYATNSTVKAGIAAWGQGWFISQKVSNHQRGGAIDVSLAKIDAYSNIEINFKSTIRVTAYTEYSMPTAMHELSVKAAALASPVSNKDGSWKKVALASSMTEGSRLLNAYCTGAGMVPLASEWWHFEDLTAMSLTGNAGAGEYDIHTCMSK